jgi:TRAP-type C4-dicarboxylate transport system substrate-binding protein
VTDLGDEYTPAEARTHRVFDRLQQRMRTIMTSAADDAANAVADQLVKAKAEIDAVIAELESQSVRPETLQRLQGISQSLDDENPDAPVEPPA